MFPLAFVAGWLQSHWWGFISRNYVVWPTFFLMNVFIALKGSHLWFLLWGSYHNISQEQSRKEPVSVEFFWVLCHCPPLLPTASMLLAITAHGVSSYFSETLYRNIAIMIIRLSTDKIWQTVQTDIRLKASLKYICTSDGYKGDSCDSERRCMCSVHIYLCMYIQHHIADMFKQNQNNIWLISSLIVPNKKYISLHTWL